MKELSDAEIEFIDDMLDEMSDVMRHHPQDFSEEKVKAYESTSEKIRAEAKRRKLWWTQ